MVAQRLLGRLGKFRQVEAGPVGCVGHHDAEAARNAGQPEPARACRTAHRDGVGDVDDLFDAVRAVNAVVVQHRIEHFV